MVHANSSMSPGMGAMPPRTFRPKKNKRPDMPPRDTKHKITWSAVEVHAASLLQDDFEMSVASMIQAIDLARAHKREEFLVLNIAPGAMVGSADVSEAQQALEEVIQTAFSRTGRAAPELRLSLRGHEYDLRLYLGRTKPTDFRFDHDA